MSATATASASAMPAALQPSAAPPPVVVVPSALPGTAAAAAVGPAVIYQHWTGVYPVLTRDTPFPFCVDDLRHHPLAPSTRACVQAVKNALRSVQVNHALNFDSLSLSDKVDALLEIHVFLMSEFYRVATAEAAIKGVYEKQPSSELQRMGLLRPMTDLQKLATPWKTLWGQDVIPEFSGLGTAIHQANYMISNFNKKEFLKHQERLDQLNEMDTPYLDTLFEEAYRLARKTAVRSARQGPILQQLKTHDLLGATELLSAAHQIEAVAKMIQRESRAKASSNSAAAAKSAQSSASAAAAAAAAMMAPPPPRLSTAKGNGQAAAAAAPASGDEKKTNSSPRVVTTGTLMGINTEDGLDLFGGLNKQQTLALLGKIFQNLNPLPTKREKLIDKILQSFEKWVLDSAKNPLPLDKLYSLSWKEAIRFLLKLQPYICERLFRLAAEKDIPVESATTSFVNHKLAPIFHAMIEEFNKTPRGIKPRELPKLKEAQTLLLSWSLSHNPVEKAQRLQTLSKEMSDEALRSLVVFAVHVTPQFEKYLQDQAKPK